MRQGRCTFQMVHDDERAHSKLSEAEPHRLSALMPRPEVTSGYGVLDDSVQAVSLRLSHDFWDAFNMLKNSVFAMCFVHKE